MVEGDLKFFKKNILFGNIYGIISMNKTKRRKEMKKINKKRIEEVVGNGDVMGATMDFNGNLVEYDEGYIFGITRKFAIEFGIGDKKIYTLDDVENIVEQLYGTEYYEGLQIGFWINEGDIYYDVVKHEYDFDTAIEIAAECGELAIYDCYEKDVVLVNEE